MTMYLLYKIINKVNGKIYIGAHQTENVYDGYMGSGRLIQKAIKKYGLENFEKHILMKFDSKEDMYNMESIIVNEEFLKRNDVYNLKEGGSGGWDHQNKNSDIQKQKNRKSQEKLKILRNTPGFLDKTKLTASKTMKRLHQEGKIKYDTFTGKTHSEESKIKIGIANSIKQKGDKNSNYGKCWIYNETEKKSISVPKNEVDEWVTKGWKIGRKIKW